MSFGAAQEASREMEVQSVSSEVCRTYERVHRPRRILGAVNGGFVCVFGDASGAGARTQCGDSRDDSVSISR